MAGLNVMPGSTVIIVAVRHRADDAKLVAGGRQARKLIADQQARRFAGGRLEGAADLFGRIRLEVEGLELARSAEEGQENDGLRSWRDGRSDGLRREELRQ